MPIAPMLLRFRLCLGYRERRLPPDFGHALLRRAALLFRDAIPATATASCVGTCCDCSRMGDGNLHSHAGQTLRNIFRLQR